MYYSECICQYISLFISLIDTSSLLLPHNVSVTPFDPSHRVKLMHPIAAMYEQPLLKLAFHLNRHSFHRLAATNSSDASITQLLEAMGIKRLMTLRLLRGRTVCVMCA
jgi:hypothetical protein